MITLGWTPDRVDTLKRLWLDGLSYSQIARQLGGTSRNALIGKINRMGMSYRATPADPQHVFRTARPRPPRPPKAALKAPKAPAYIVLGRLHEGKPATPLPPLREITLSVEPRHWLTRKFGECAWPVSGEGAATLSCCAPSSGATYCAAHHRLSHQPGRGAWSNTDQLIRSVRMFS